ncbi:hypothetical protein AK830_g4859 [Neonectria ditissima]|uniref:Uncharacterized protein n=1 Tax=Neonectria ditissima TaxID=78410 RepID=A0A0P7B7C4_9HYPO|nr:hypothetical protein AK830_g4859 [Neonectria ditissima]
MSDASPAAPSKRRDSLAHQLEAAKFRVCDHCRILYLQPEKKEARYLSFAVEIAVDEVANHSPLRFAGPPKRSQRGARSPPDASLTGPSSRQTFTDSRASPSSMLETLGVFEEAIDKSTYTCNRDSANWFDDDAVAQHQLFDNPLINASSYDSLGLPSTANFLYLDPEVEAYLCITPAPGHESLCIQC